MDVTEAGYEALWAGELDKLLANCATKERERAVKLALLLQMARPRFGLRNREGWAEQDTAIARKLARKCVVGADLKGILAEIERFDIFERWLLAGIRKLVRP
jgi:hypothetical protein